MKKKLLFNFVIFVLFSYMVYAAGGGGGGSTFSTPDCTNNSYACTEWSPCSEDGKQIRKCTLVDQCIEKSKKPLETAECEYVSSLESNLKCGNLDTLRQRVKCRLELSNEEQEKELNLKFLPEECGAIKDNQLKREQCIIRYKSFQKCWRFKDGPERFSCVRKELNLGQNLSIEIKTCNDRLGTERASCIKDVRERVFSEIKFRFYNLEERAEYLGERGVDKELITEFVAGIEIKKQEFNNAQNNEERKQIVKDVQKKWKEFFGEAKQQIK